MREPKILNWLSKLVQLLRIYTTVWQSQNVAYIIKLILIFEYELTKKNAIVQGVKCSSFFNAVHFWKIPDRWQISRTVVHVATKTRQPANLWQHGFLLQNFRHPFLKIGNFWNAGGSSSSRWAAGFLDCVLSLLSSNIIILYKFSSTVNCFFINPITLNNVYKLLTTFSIIISLKYF